MAEHHEAPHGAAKAEKGGHDSQEKKGKKEGIRSMMAKQLRIIFSFTALFALANFVTQEFAKPIFFDTMRGGVETAATLTGSAVSDINLGGSGGAGTGHDHAAPKH